MKTELVAAVGAVPLTMFILANVGGNTAQMTHVNRDAVRESLAVASGAMIVAAVATRSVPITIATAGAIGLSLWGMRQAWDIPSFRDVATPGF